jgi:hypothetical protein
MIDGFIQQYQQAPEEIVLDIDGWDDPTHGQQQLSCFHGYYGQHMYFPVLINEAKSGYPLVLQLRSGNSHPGKGVAGILRWLFWGLKRASPDVRIILRADAGFALSDILRVCECAGVGYVIGFGRNAVTERKIADLLERARLCFQRPHPCPEIHTRKSCLLLPLLARSLARAFPYRIKGNINASLVSDLKSLVSIENQESQSRHRSRSFVQ